MINERLIRVKGPEEINKNKVWNAKDMHQLAMENREMKAYANARKEINDLMEKMKERATEGYGFIDVPELSSRAQYFLSVNGYRMEYVNLGENVEALHRIIWSDTQKVF